jgi:Protein of unknown function (DUF2865)
MYFRYVLQAIVSLAAVLLLPFVLADAAHAQSFFETLFGGSKTATSPGTERAPSRLQPLGGQAGVNSGNAYTAPLQVQRSRADHDEDHGPPGNSSDRGRTYRTVCVRMCDGFYWPVSFAATRSRFYRDANVCSSSCTSEAKLFHFPANGGQIDDAVDLTGRVYSRLPAAFKYRKALTPSCTCKPEPWSAAEADRHRTYTAKDETGKDTQSTPNKSAEYPVPPQSGPQAAVAVSDAKGVDQQSKAPESPVEDANSSAVAPKVKLPKPQKVTVVRAPAINDAPPRPTARPRQQMASPRPVQGEANSGGFWGGGQASKYSWPGDAPVRVR